MRFLCDLLDFELLSRRPMFELDHITDSRAHDRLAERRLRSNDADLKTMEGKARASAGRCPRI